MAAKKQTEEVVETVETSAEINSNNEAISSDLPKIRNLSEYQLVMSESIMNLTRALNKTKIALGSPTVGYDAKNPAFKSNYATLDATLEKVQQPMADNGLELIQAPTGKLLYSLLTHTSGEFISSTYELDIEQNARNKAQATGSAITYARRYALQALLGIAPGDDDDGNSNDRSSGNYSNKPSSPSSNSNSGNSSQQAATQQKKSPSGNSSGPKNLLQLTSALGKSTTTDEVEDLIATARRLFKSKEITEAEGKKFCVSAEEFKEKLSASGAEALTN